MVRHLFDFDQVLRCRVARGFPVFQFDELFERQRVAFPGPHQISLEPDFDRRLNADQLEMFGIPEGCRLPRDCGWNR